MLPSIRLKTMKAMFLIVPMFFINYIVAATRWTITGDISIIQMPSVYTAFIGFALLILTLNLFLKKQWLIDCAVLILILTLVYFAWVVANNPIWAVIF